MPERISGISAWLGDIWVALVFWFIGATIGIGQHLLSCDLFSWRVVVGRSLSTGGLAVAAGAVLLMHPSMPPLAQIGIAAAIASLGTNTVELVFRRYVLGSNAG